MEQWGAEEPLALGSTASGMHLFPTVALWLWPPPAQPGFSVLNFPGLQ